MDASTRGDRSRAIWPFVERRRARDRRGSGTAALAPLGGRRRRWGSRRRSDRREGYADRFAAADVALVLAIFVLNLADAALTLDHMAQGGVEANPLVGALLRRSTSAFVWEKIALVGACLVLLAVHRRFRLARLGLWALLAIYSALLLYHLALVVATGGAG